MTISMSHTVIQNLLTTGQAYREAANALHAAPSTSRKRKKLAEAHEQALHRLHLCEDLARTFLDSQKEA